MIKRPNSILTNIITEGKRWNVIYIRDEDGDYSYVGSEYIKTDDPINLEPFVNWLDIPNKEFVHPCISRSDGKGGWWTQAYDTYNEVRWNNENTTLSKLNEEELVFQFFDKVLDDYKNMTDDELLEELNVGRIDKWTKEELEKL